MAKVNPSNENEAKSDIFPWVIFKSDTTYFFAKICESISMNFEIRISQFYD